MTNLDELDEWAKAIVFSRGYEVRQLIAENKALRSALTAAVEIIRTLHCLSFNGNGPLAAASWEAYQQEGEMTQIMEAMK